MKQYKYSFKPAGALLGFALSALVFAQAQAPNFFQNGTQFVCQAIGGSKPFAAAVTFGALVLIALLIILARREGANWLFSVIGGIVVFVVAAPFVTVAFGAAPC